MTLPYVRAPHTDPIHSGMTAPNAGLLIDFDNVTMGMRSDLAKELKNLLDSDIIKGKVTVQRAYADWRRYPQYIVPLSEASIDLIFAPAYGSSKKNATDIRMAIDGMELVFTRPEIGTFILLTGDSDFSSLVLKLKEYGKYVIGIGIQESSSDILVQNCDEYYSYTSLTGLTKTSELDRVPTDPWELVKESVDRMAARNDVMRSDRLKQVMLEISPSFNEQDLRFKKFSKFLIEAANRGLITLTRGENGQYEVAPGDGGGEDRPDASSRSRGGSSSRGGRASKGNGRSGGARTESRGSSEEARPIGGRATRGSRSRRGRETQPEEIAAATTPMPSDGAASQSEAKTEVESKPKTDRALEDGTARKSRERSSDSRAPSEGSDDTQERPGTTSGRPLASAGDLLVEALNDLRDSGKDSVRDSDVKRRMLAKDRSFDEGTLGFAKFSKFLLKARDEGLVSLEALETGNYVVSLPEGPTAESAAATPGATEDRDTVTESESPQAQAATESKPSDGRREAPARTETDPTEVSSSSGAGVESTWSRPSSNDQASPAESVSDAAQERSPTASEVAAETGSGAESPSTGPARGMGPRRGERGRKGGAKGPILLEGQVAGKSVSTPSPEAPTPEAAPAEVMAPAPEPSRNERGSEQVETQPKADTLSLGDGGPRIDTRKLGLPSTSDSMVSYLSNRYRGVGTKTAESLVEEFGEDLFTALQYHPDRVRRAVPASRAQQVLDAWNEDYARRTGTSSDGAEG